MTNKMLPVPFDGSTVSDSETFINELLAAYPIKADTPIKVPIRANLNQGTLDVMSWELYIFLPGVTPVIS